MGTLKSRIVNIDRTIKEGSKIYVHTKKDILLRYISQTAENIYTMEILYSSDNSVNVGDVALVSSASVIPITSASVEFYTTE